MLKFKEFITEAEKEIPFADVKGNKAKGVVVKNKWIRVDSYAHGKFNKTWKVGDEVIYYVGNNREVGKITNISDKVVSVFDKIYNKKINMKINDFFDYNKDADVNQTKKDNKRESNFRSGTVTK